MKHDTLLDGLKLDATPRSEVIAPSFVRYDLSRDLMKNFLNDLRADDWMDRLKARSDLEMRDGLPLIDQHLHRKAVIVIVDAVCLTPGFPRLDPRKVPEAGFVIRRDDADTQETNLWSTDRDGAPLGWVAAPEGLNAVASDYEPDGARRRDILHGANRALAHKTRLTGDAEGVSEVVHKLFAIPDDIAKKIGRSILFAVLPTTSRAEQPATAPPPPFTAKDVAERVPNLLRADRDDTLLVQTSQVTRAAFRSENSSAVADLRSTLTWLAQEVGLFTGVPQATSLRDRLEAVPLIGADQPNLLAWLEAAQAILVENRDPAESASFTDRIEGPGTIPTPDNWPRMTNAQFDAITAAAYGAIAARWSTMAPTVTRFGSIGDRYHVRCFARVDDRPDCPSRIVWSPLSKRYSIRPWYESGGAPPQQIDLPNLGDLSNIKPDVVINVPPEIQPFMDKMNLQSLMDGDAPKGGLTFGMICGFSIPIITICAFIILQIFLQLLNIIFYWLPFVKICIPYPKPK